MIPKVSINLDEVEIQSIPSKDYRMYLETQRIYGKCDKLAVMTQVVYKRLATERYQHIIYSWNYGVELQDLFGEPMSYVIPEVERRIKEALLVDERIESVDSFEFDTSKRHELTVKFTVHTIFGDIDATKEVGF